MNPVLRLLHLAGTVLLLLTFSACRQKANSGGGSRGPQQAREVSVVPASSSEIERTITVFGSFLAREQATLSTKVQGRLESISVDLGSEVKAGAEIARIEPREYELRVRQSEAALAQARARLGLAPDDEKTEVDPEQTSVVRQAAAVLQEARSNRDRLAKLHQEGVLSKAELDSAEAAFIVAENRFQDSLEDVRQRIALVAQRKIERDIATQNLTDTRLLAPFHGAIQERRASPGEYLRVGDPIVTLVQMDPLRLRVEVTERDAPKIASGQEVRIQLEGLARRYQGKVVRVSPAIDIQRRVLLVEADIQNDGALHPGMFARADIVYQPRDNAVTVPPDAVATFAGIEKVFVIAEGKAVERIISTGVKNNSWTEILGDLKPGEQVIRRPGKMQPGQPVIVTNAPSASQTSS